MVVSLVDEGLVLSGHVFRVKQVDVESHVLAQLRFLAEFGSLVYEWFRVFEHWHLFSHSFLTNESFIL